MINDKIFKLFSTFRYSFGLDHSHQPSFLFNLYMYKFLGHISLQIKVNVKFFVQGLFFIFNYFAMLVPYVPGGTHLQVSQHAVHVLMHILLLSAKWHL
jgi:hypothetical protein